MQKINRTRAIAFCVIAMLLAATTSCRNTHVKATEYEVLSVFINSKFASQRNIKPLEPTGEGIARIVICNLTDSNEQESSWRLLDGNGQQIPWTQTASSLLSQAPALERTTVDAFREVNAKQTNFKRSFQLEFDYELIDTAELDSIFKNGNWPAYYKRFPGSPGILRFSRVGFNADGTQAFFYAENNCGGLCGGGEFVLMERRDGRWLIEKEIQMWIS